MKACTDLKTATIGDTDNVSVMCNGHSYGSVGKKFILQLPQVYLISISAAWLDCFCLCVVLWPN